MMAKLEIHTDDGEAISIQHPVTMALIMRDIRSCTNRVYRVCKQFVFRHIVMKIGTRARVSVDIVAMLCPLSAELSSHMDRIALRIMCETTVARSGRQNRNE